MKSYRLRKLEKKKRREERKEEERRMLDRNNHKTTSISEEVNDQLTVRKAIFPLWVFADMNQARWVKGAYWCFVGCNYPHGIQLTNEEMYKKALDYIVTGRHMADCKKVQPNVKMGWGNAATPDEAFKDAIKMAGYFTMPKETS